MLITRVEKDQSSLSLYSTMNKKENIATPERLELSRGNPMYFSRHMFERAHSTLRCRPLLVAL
jgi:hypothetical protein